jgi:hypothetical protein
MSRANLPLAAVTSVARVKDGVYNFDLSQIDRDYFCPILSAIYTVGKTKWTGIGFNCQLEDQTPSYVKHPPVELENSAKRLIPNLVPDLIGLLSRVLPKTITLKVLKFRSLRNFAFRETDVLAQSVARCQSLRVLKLRNIPLADEGFIRLAKALRRRAVITLQCRKCNLTDAIGSTLSSLIEYHAGVQAEAEQKAKQQKDRTLGIICLSQIDLRDNRLTKQFVDTVESIVTDSPVVKLDLRGNHRITAEDKVCPKIVVDVPHSELSLEDREAELHQENQRLKATLREMTHDHDVEILGTGLYAIGKRSGDLADHLAVLNQVCERMEAEMAATRSPVRARPPQKSKHLKHRPIVPE